MFTPQKLEKIPLELEKLFSKLEMDIMVDIVRRMKLNGNEITRSADWQINRLKELGQSNKSIKKYIQSVLELSEKEINDIYKNVIKEGYAEDESLYKATGNTFIRFEDNEELQQIINSYCLQTNNELHNITNSTGFFKNDNGRNVFTPLTQYYQDTLDDAINGITNGAFDYNTAIKKVVQEMTKSGLRVVDYASGKSFRIDVAARMSLMTGVNQVVSKISDMNAEKLETEYFEVSAHGTARPTHQKWQGKVYTRKELEDVCGLGKVDGLRGANCRHSYSPFIPGISTRTYTDEELKEMADKENTPIKYGDKEYTAYEATQEQRKLERTMRKLRQDIKLLKEGGADEEDIKILKAKYRITSAEYTKFSEAMNLPEQRARIYQDGLKKDESTISTNTKINDKISADHKIGEQELRYIGKLDKEKLGEYKEKIVIDEVVLTDERLKHIYEDHKNDYETIIADIDNAVLNPDEVINDLKNENTVFMIKKLIKNNLSVVVKLNVDNSKEHPKNSIMTAWIIRNKNLKKLEEKNKIIYKSE